MIAAGGVLAVGASYFAFRKWLAGNDFRHDVSLRERNILITGATSGIGKEAAKELAKMGANIILACRSPNKATAVVNEIAKESKGANIMVLELDLSSLASIQKFAAEFNMKNIPLHVLINNAGVWCPPTRMLTTDGFELQFGTNHLGHFLLTTLLEKSLIAGTQQSGVNSRVVVVASRAHYKGTMQWDDLQGERSYVPNAFYRQSKLANVLFANYLSKLWQPKGIMVNSMCPGVCYTNLWDSAKGPVATPLIAVFGSLFLRSASEGARTVVHLAADPSLTGVTGKYFSDCQPLECSAAAKSEADAEKLWQFSEQIVIGKGK